MTQTKIRSRLFLFVGSLLVARAVHVLNSTKLDHHRRMLKDTSCSMSSCHGVNLLAAIKKDLKPWIDKGSITPRDIDMAEKQLSKVEGYIRVSIIDGEHPIVLGDCPSC